MHRRNTLRGRFIVIDGIDGSGKGTEVRLLKKELKRVPTLFTHEPGGTAKADEIRKVLLQSGRSSTPLADFFLFWAARASLVGQAILPALLAGRNVISDRFDSSTFAYQIIAEKHPELAKFFNVCRKAVLGKSVPDAYIFLDLPVSVALARRRKDTKKRDAFDNKPASYHERVREGFKKFKPAGSRVFFVDAGRSPAEVHQEVLGIVKRILR